MSEQDLYSGDGEGTVDGASPASIVGGTPVVNMGDREPDAPPLDIPGMENVQQLPGDSTASIDIELPPDAERGV